VQLAAARVRRHRDEPARLEGGGGLSRVAEALVDDEVAAPASPTRIRMVATLFPSVPAKSRGASGARAAATLAHAGSGA
jgi:hypothetical protein